MNLLTEQERVLVARSVAALRRRGLPAGRALKLVAERLPGGAVRERLTECVATLERGTRVVPSRSGDPLLRLLVQGEAAGPGAMDQAVRAFELELQARQGMAGLSHLLLASGVMMVVMGVVAGEVGDGFQALYTQLGQPAPAATEWTVGVLASARWLGPLAGIALVLAGLKRTLGQRVSGTAALMEASRLRLFAAGRSAGLDDATSMAMVAEGRFTSWETSPAFNLDVLEQRLARWLMGQSTSGVAASSLADEREAQGNRKAERMKTVMPAALLGIALVVAFNVLGPLYLPVFTLAGATGGTEVPHAP